MQGVKPEEEIREIISTSSYVLTEEDKQDIKDGRSEYKVGSSVNHEQVKKLIEVWG